MFKGIKMNNLVKQAILIAMALLQICGFGMMSLDKAEAATIQYSGTSGSCSWEIDSDGLLRIYSTDGVSGILDSNTSNSSSFWPWYSYLDSITKVVVDEGVSANSNASYMFYNLENCTEMDLTNLDTNNVTDMGSMFNCTGDKASIFVLTGLNSWNISNVTNLRAMFREAGLNASTWNIGNLSNWDTGSVTDMSYMFHNAGYYKATTFDVGDLSNWDTGNVTNMQNMFYFAGSEKATTWYIGDLSGWDTSNVTNMSDMFYFAGNKAGTFNLDLSNWDTGNVTDMSNMFYKAGYNARTWSIGDISGWATSNVTNMSYMFNHAGKNASTFSLDLSGWDTSNVTNMSNMFSGACHNASIFSLDLSGWDTSNVTNIDFMFYYAGHEANTFTLNLSGWNISNVTNMTSMFYQAGYKASIFSLDLSGWNTGNVTNMNSMFREAGQNAKTAKIVFGSEFKFIGTNHRFSDLGRNWVKTQNADGSETYDRTTYTATQISTLTNSTSPALAGTWEKIGARAIYSADDNSLTFIYGGFILAGDAYNDKTVTNVYTGFDTATYTGNTYVPWKDYREYITKVVVQDSIKPKSTAYWFYQFKNCSEFDLTNLDTSNVTNMTNMFYYAGYSVSTFELIGLESWDTSNVTNTSDMFDSAGENASTWNIGDISEWDTSNVTDMSDMFSRAGYYAGTWDIGDISGWNTSNVTNMSHMFANAGYTASTFSLDLSGWDTGKVTDMKYMFQNAGQNASTFSLDLSEWDTSNVISMYLMFNYAGKNATSAKIVFGSEFEFIGTPHGFAINNLVKTRNVDGSKTYDKTEYTGTQIAALNNTDSTPLLGGTWVKYGVENYITNHDGSIEYISVDSDWEIISDNVWKYSFSVFDDSLLFYLFEEVIEGYTSEAMNGYYVEVFDKMATITNTADENIIETGKLVISKTVVGTDTTDKFGFTITLTGDDISSGNQVFSNVIFTNGVGKIFLAHGESKTLELPIGTTYSIVEDTNVFYESSIENATGTITKDSVITVKAVNALIETPEVEDNTVNITIRKNAQGFSNSNQAFTMFVYFNGLEAGKTYIAGTDTFAANSNGTAYYSFEVQNGSEIVFYNIPVGATYQFTEQGGEDYIASYQISNKQ